MQTKYNWKCTKQFTKSKELVQLIQNIAIEILEFIYKYMDSLTMFGCFCLWWLATTGRIKP